MTTVKTSLPTIRDAFKRDSIYYGERAEWLIAYTITRDASALARSNWRCFIQLLGGTGDEGAKGTQNISDTVAIEEASHWACGWIQYLIIDPSAQDKVALALKTLEGLDDYPVINEEDWSNLEHEEYSKAFDDNCRFDLSRGLKEYISELSFDMIAHGNKEALREWFESCIPSGEYHGEGCYPNFYMVCRDCSRDDIARLIRALRVAKRQS